MIPPEMAAYADLARSNRSGLSLNRTQSGFHDAESIRLTSITVLML